MGQNACCQQQIEQGGYLVNQPIKSIHSEPQQKQTNIFSSSVNQNKLTTPEDSSNRSRILEPPLNQNVKLRKSALGQLKIKNNLNRGEFDPLFYLFQKSSKIYHGQWKNSKPHGFGCLYFPNGSLYEGDFIQGIPYGYGRLILTSGSYYQGQIKFGRACGQGTYQNQDCIYKGGFKDDDKHGQGQQNKKNGYFYKGLFQYGHKTFGTLKFQDIVYQGQFSDDNYDGKGTLTTPQGQFKGDFKDGQPHGYGEFFWKDGSIYRGNYHQGERQGDGQFFNSQNSSISRGFWKKGVLNGTGQYVQPRGKIHKVIWTNGKITALRSCT